VSKEGSEPSSRQACLEEKGLIRLGKEEMMRMRLEAFRVQNYKKVRDTGWVSCRELTVFVGKNEAGKSAVFRGFSKLNPSDGTRYDALKEFPRRRYADEFSSQDWPVASGRFVLDDEERHALARKCPLLKGVKKVEATRHYSWELTIEFDPMPKAAPVSRPELRAAVDEAIPRLQDLTAPEGKGDIIGAVKSSSLAALQAVKDQVPGDGAVVRSQIEQAVNAIAMHANEDWQKKLLDPVAAPLKKLAERAAACEKLGEARLWVQTHLPKFIYFGRFDVLDSEIHIPSFVQQLNSGSAGGLRVRATNRLFRHVGLDVHKLSSLGRHPSGQAADATMRRQVDERAILASSASNAMTKKFEDWWEQRRHKFRYQLDGDYFRVWVSDDLDPSEIELDQRSVGMQYFFSLDALALPGGRGPPRTGEGGLRGRRRHDKDFRRCLAARQGLAVPLAGRARLPVGPGAVHLQAATHRGGHHRLLARQGTQPSICAAEVDHTEG
jgi:hypothetical protein